MRIEVKVKPRCKIEKVSLTEEGVYEVCVNTPPVDGKANKRVHELLASFFNVSKSRVQILRGGKSRYKQFDIETS